MSNRVVVVGNGMAGSRFVQELLQRDRSFDVTVIGDELGGAYNRMQLSNVLAGATRATEIELATQEWYAAHGVTLHSGRAVTHIDRARKRVVVDGTAAVGYDLLVLATGSSAVLPPIDGLMRDGALIPGAAPFRTLDDCAEIDRLATMARRAIVLGAGVLGLEAARGLAGRGLEVAMVDRAPHLMERQLDPTAGRVLARTIAELGIEVIPDVLAKAVHGGDRFTGVTLSDGTVREADLLVLCCGVRPRVELARDAGLAVNAGVVVDDRLRSVTDDSILAIGECAEHRGQVYGLVAPAWEHARIAAELVADPSRPVRYTGSGIVMRLKAAGIELAAMGETCHDDDDDVRFVDGARGVYQKLVVRDGRLVGAILLGDTRTVGTVTQLFDRGAPLPADRASLLMVRRNAPLTTAQSPTALPGRTTICQCNGVTKTAICDAWQDGARSVRDIADRTRATTGCGTCRDTVEGLVEWLVAADPGARAEETAVPA